MTSDDVSVQEPGTISRRAFRRLVVALGFAFLIPELIVLTVACRVFGFRHDHGWIAGLPGGLSVLNTTLAYVATDRILKRFGLSRSGKTMEVRGKTVAHAEGEVFADELIEVRFHSSHFIGLGLTCLVCSLVMALIFVVISRDRMIGGCYACITVALSGFLGGTCLYLGLWGKPRVWADADGITGHPLGFNIGHRSVSWSAVATCEIQTVFNTFGKPILIRPTLKGYDGNSLLALDLSYTKMEDQERLVKFIKARLPKSKEDFWE